LTGDTFKKSADQVKGIACRLIILSREHQDTAKVKYVRNLGADQTVAIGNGRNDRRMLTTAALGIAVLGEEGTAVDAIVGAHLVCRDIFGALDLLQNPLRLVASLRS